MRRRGPVHLDLSERDRAVVQAVTENGLLTTRHVERLFFDGLHATDVATRRRCQAVLQRLVELELLERLHRRQGGHRAGSAGFTYRVTTRGRRAIGLNGRPAREEPSDMWTAHTLACSEISVRLREVEHAGIVRTASVSHEPNCWRRFVGQHGGREVLKPDLLVDLITLDNWRLRWWIEVDRSTHHMPAVIRKCQQYEACWRSGIEAEPVFPVVLWSVPDERRASAIREAIARTRGLTPELFRVATTQQTVRVLVGQDNNQREGGES